jgi:hypothetical protein
MKFVKIVNEQWFKTASLEEVTAVGIGHLGIPAPQIIAKDDEGQKRNLVKQVFKQKVKAGEFDFGAEFDIHTDEPQANPFKVAVKGAGVKKSVAVSTLKGNYSVNKCRLRAPDNDLRWELWQILTKHKDFESLNAAYVEKYGKDAKFPTKGSCTFTAMEFAAWAVRCSWIVVV